MVPALTKGARAALARAEWSGLAAVTGAAVVGVVVWALATPSPPSASEPARPVAAKAYRNLEFMMSLSNGPKQRSGVGR